MYVLFTSNIKSMTNETLSTYIRLAKRYTQELFKLKYNVLDFRLEDLAKGEEENTLKSAVFSFLTEVTGVSKPRQFWEFIFDEDSVILASYRVERRMIEVWEKVEDCNDVNIKEGE